MAEATKKRKVYKILHLPTATYMWYDLITHSKNIKFKHNNIYTHYEIENQFFSCNRPSDEFKSLRTAESYLDGAVHLKEMLMGEGGEPLLFSGEDAKDYTPIREHFTIVGFKNGKEV